MKSSDQFYIFADSIFSIVIICKLKIKFHKLNLQRLVYI